MTEMNVTESSEKKSLNFIEQIVEKDLKEGKNGGRIQNWQKRSGIIQASLHGIFRMN